MTDPAETNNRVRQCRTLQGLTQAELAEQAGISRTAVTAIEAGRMIPSVASALAIASAMGTTVEDLFGSGAAITDSEVWAWNPPSVSSPSWRAEVGGKTVRYPAASTPTLTLLPDQVATGVAMTSSVKANETLVMASCDPAAGILASQFIRATGFRLIVLFRSSRQAMAMLREGLVHLAGIHFSTRDEPDRNSEIIRSDLGSGYQSVRISRWQEGIVLRPGAAIDSVGAAMKSNLHWVGRESGSGARQCLDRLLNHRSQPQRIAQDHRSVVEAVRSGWADAGICVQLAGAEAGLKFLPVQDEAFDMTYRSDLSSDLRIKAFLSVIRSRSYRKLIGGLPGYDTSETGTVWSDS